VAVWQEAGECHPHLWGGTRGHSRAICVLALHRDVKGMGVVALNGGQASKPGRGGEGGCVHPK